MNILWITNFVLPEAEKLLNKSGDLRNSGGWLVGLSDVLSSKENIRLSIASISGTVSSLNVLHGDRITYYVLPQKGDGIHYSSAYSSDWISVKKLVSPDVVHIHGTEFPHALSYIESCGADNVVVSIQGLVSAYYYYYYYGQSFWDVFRNITLRDVIRGGTFTGKKNFANRSKSEVALLKSVHHVIGRTSWDRSHVWALNPSATYYFNNETLRKEFYDASKWSYDNCEKHSIFLCQGSVPYKGLHQVIKALPLIKREFPDVKVYVAGWDICRRNSYKDRLKMTGYGKYISKLVKKLGVDERIVFTGPLSAEEMIHYYKQANVFICPSAIENSPNSVGEAQLIGVPVIASFVGGMADMIPDENCGELYRFEEIEMLADKICNLFSRHIFDNTAMIETATKRHCGEENVTTLLTIYNKVAEENV